MKPVDADNPLSLKRELRIYFESLFKKGALKENRELAKFMQILQRPIDPINIPLKNSWQFGKLCTTPKSTGIHNRMVNSKRSRRCTSIAYRYFVRKWAKTHESHGYNHGANLCLTYNNFQGKRSFNVIKMTMRL